jgi:hypothetical protein
LKVPTKNVLNATPFHPFVKAALHREPLEDESDVRESLNRLAKLARAVLPEHRRVLVLEVHLHQLRQGVEPGHAVVDLEHGLPTGLQDSPDFLRQLPAVPCVLDDAVSEDESRSGCRETAGARRRPPAAVPAALVREILPGKANGRLRHVHSRDASAATGEAHEIDARSTAHLQNVAAPEPVERDERQQMMELLEVILVEVLEEAGRPDRVRRDREIVDMGVPVGPDPPVQRAGQLRRVRHDP